MPPEDVSTEVQRAHAKSERDTTDLIGRLRAAGLQIVERDSRPLLDQLETSRDVDVLVARRDSLSPEDLEAIEASVEVDGAPSVVVLGTDVGAHDRTSLLAAGVTHVVDGGLGSKWLRTALDAVARAEAESASLSDEPRLSDFISHSSYMRRFVELVRRVADADSTLLITGDTGVGKERLARAIHAERSDPDSPFVAVNCGALPEQLLESELFGHVKGAFTGADDDRKGHFQAADGGTLFLDEIGEMPQHVQVKLLTVLERREVVPVGSSEGRPVDVRVLAATNRDLRDEVAAGRFREDLYYRLNVIPLEIPSLKERREDIPDLVGSMIAWFRRDLDRREVQGIEPAALQALMDYSWPGNVREVSNAIERAVLLCEGDEIRLRDLPEEVRGTAAPLEAPGRDTRAGDSTAPGASSTADLPADWRELSLKEIRQAAADRCERAFLDAVMDEVGGIVKDAAARCGIAPRSLYDRLRRHGIRKEDYR
ncbi:sigma-54 interaction domain-containing protein [Engelhardtia mirabilis]|uniref:Transcriptional regulatory protein ZraR n=1 Tax=Engelhardtia mirabilis TaxID=2528011 RepID=A0A518BSX1_9BACT|nr:Transcriptional regulatory protein ZraR [Planctomycetes bacterium Pla133]QDV04395.1 Transcriptional regulatory protein ZraR [Planctomycetes bacterium Pla86]